MACSHRCDNLYGAGQTYFPCLLSDGCCDRISLSGLWDDKVAVFSFDRKNRAVCMDTSDGHSDCRSHLLFPVEPLYIGENCQRNERFDHCGNRSAGRAVWRMHLYFPNRPPYVYAEDNILAKTLPFYEQILHSLRIL